MGLLSFLGALIALVSLILVAISLATNHWVDLDDRPLNARASPMNPVRVNNKLPGLSVRYDLDHFGLWIGCHKEKTFGGKKSCAYIGNKCYSDVCWIRNKRDKTCMDNRVKPVSNCAAFQATRVMAILGTLALIFGTALLVVSICVMSTALASTGALLTGIGSFLLMIAFAVFHKEIYKDGSLDDIGKLGWSFVLLIIGWPLAFLASLLGCASSAAARKDRDVFESEG